MTSPGSFESIESLPHGTQQIDKKIGIIFKIPECILEVRFENIIIVSISTIFAYHQFLHSIFDNCTNAFCRIYVRTVVRPNRIAQKLTPSSSRRCCVALAFPR